MRTFRILFIGVGLLLAVSLFVLVEASPTNQEGNNEEFLVVDESCTSKLTLANAPNGVSGFQVRVNVEVNGTSTAMIKISEEFPLTQIKPVQAVIIAGVDLGELIQAGATNVVLFEITPCVAEFTILQLDDDLGNLIVPTDTIVRP